VVYHGRVVVQDKIWLHRPEKPFVYPPAARQTIKTKGPILAENLALRSPSNAMTATVQVIDVGGARKKIARAELPVTGGVIRPVAGSAYANLVVIDRHHADGKIGRGFVANSGIRRGALASSVNHNVHHLFAVGANQDDMALALNRLIEIGGGYVAALDGKIIGEVALPIIGMISELPLEQLAAEFDAMDRALRDGLGCVEEERSLLSFSFMCSPVSMECGLTDIGLVNSLTLEIEPVVLEALVREPA
jgi:adenine deaminase